MSTDDFLIVDTFASKWFNYTDKSEILKGCSEMRISSFRCTKKARSKVRPDNSDTLSIFHSLPPTFQPPPPYSRLFAWDFVEHCHECIFLHQGNIISPLPGVCAHLTCECNKPQQFRCAVLVFLHESHCVYRVVYTSTVLRESCFWFPVC